MRNDTPFQRDLRKPKENTTDWLRGPKITMRDLLNGSTLVSKMRSTELAGKSGGTYAGNGVTRVPIKVTWTPKPVVIDPLGNDTWDLNK